MMKKYLLLAGISALAIACGNNASDKKAEETKATTETPAPAPAPEAAQDDQGIALIAGSDCLTCHKVNEKAIGPAYVDVAKKYTADDATIHTLATKIIKGGSGNWGEVPMTPHPQVSEADATTMVKYILSLKNQ